MSRQFNPYDWAGRTSTRACGDPRLPHWSDLPVALPPQEDLTRHWERKDGRSPVIETQDMGRDFRNPKIDDTFLDSAMSPLSQAHGFGVTLC